MKKYDIGRGIITKKNDGEKTRELEMIERDAIEGTKTFFVDDVFESIVQGCYDERTGKLCLTIEIDVDMNRLTGREK